MRELSDILIDNLRIIIVIIIIMPIILLILCCIYEPNTINSPIHDDMKQHYNEVQTRIWGDLYEPINEYN